MRKGRERGRERGKERKKKKQGKGRRKKEKEGMGRRRRERGGERGKGVLEQQRYHQYRFEHRGRRQFSGLTGTRRYRGTLKYFLCC